MVIRLGMSWNISLVFKCFFFSSLRIGVVVFVLVIAVFFVLGVQEFVCIVGRVFCFGDFCVVIYQFFFWKILGNEVGLVKFNELDIYRKVIRLGFRARDLKLIVSDFFSFYSLVGDMEEIGILVLGRQRGNLEYFDSFRQEWEILGMVYDLSLQLI